MAVSWNVGAWGEFVNEKLYRVSDQSGSGLSPAT